jgi:hypothetical protein
VNDWLERAIDMAYSGMIWSDIATKLDKPKTTVYNHLRGTLGPAYKFRESIGPEDNSVILNIPDLHFPYQHPDVFDFLQAVKDRYKPTRTIQLGDECFPGDVEVMTEDGWVRFDSLQDNKRVVQVHEGGHAELVFPERVLRKSGKFTILNQHHRRITVRTTPNHNLVKIHPVTRKWHRREAWDHAGTSQWAIPRNCVLSTPPWPLSNDELRLLVAFQADGTLTKGAMRFSFRKKRKVKRLLEILESLSIPWNYHVLKDSSYTQIYVHKENTPSFLCKEFETLPLHEGTLEQREVVIDELVHWDGTPTSGGWRYTQARVKAIDWVSAILATSGKYGTVRWANGERSALMLNYTISPEDTALSTATVSEEEVDAVYCVTVPTGMILVRDNGSHYVVSNCDMHSMSYHEHDPDLLSAGHELEEARALLQQLYSMFPRMDILESNHGSLTWRKAKTHGIPRAFIRDYNDVLQVGPGWKWHYDLTVVLPDGESVYYHHGKSVSVLRLSQQMGMSAVQGHYHELFSINYWGNPNGLMWGLQSGCLIDYRSYAFAYAKVNIKRPVLGCSLIINSQPLLVPMVLDHGGRWIGDLP